MLGCLLSGCVPHRVAPRGLRRGRGHADDPLQRRRAARRGVAGVRRTVVLVVECAVAVNDVEIQTQATADVGRKPVVIADIVIGVRHARLVVLRSVNITVADIWVPRVADRGGNGARHAVDHDLFDVRNGGGGAGTQGPLAVGIGGAGPVAVGRVHAEVIVEAVADADIEAGIAQRSGCCRASPKSCGWRRRSADRQSTRSWR